LHLNNLDCYSPKNIIDITVKWQSAIIPSL